MHGSQNYETLEVFKSSLKAARGGRALMLKMV